MDNKTLRALVVKFRDTGMTYQEISDKLYADYNIKRSRQTLQGMYTRAMRDLTSTDKKERVLARTDIVNVYSLGYNMTEVTEIVNETFGYNLTYNEVVTTIKESQDYIEEVRAALAHKVEEQLDKCKYIYDLEEYISYNKIKPREKQLKLYVAEAYKIRLSKEFMSTLKSMKSFTDDKIVEKKVIEDLSLDTLNSTAKELARI